MKVAFYVSMSGFSGSTVEEIVELPDDAPDDYIDQEYSEWLTIHVDQGWHKVEQS